MRTCALGLLCFVLGAAVTVGHEGTHTLVARKNLEIEKDSGNARLVLERAELYRDHRDWEAALADYLRAAELDLSLDEVQRGQGRLFFEMGWHRAAAICLEGYLQRQPADAKGRRFYAAALVESGRRAEGAAAYTQAIKDTALFDPDLYLERAKALRGAGPDQYEVALRGLDDGMARVGAPVLPLQLLAIEIELERRRFDAALARLQTLAEGAARKERWLARKGEILNLAGRYDEARQAYEQAWAVIETLPPHRRRVPAIVELAARVKAAMQSEPIAARASTEGN